MASTSFLVNTLEQINEQETKVLKELRLGPAATEIYQRLRETESGAISFRALRDVLELSSHSVAQRAMEPLRRKQLVDKDDVGGRPTWTLRKVAWHEIKSFRGSMSISIQAASATLPNVPDEDELSQLFLMLEHEADAAAVYQRLREEVGREVTKADLARHLGMTSRQVNGHLSRLAAHRLIEERPDVDAILVHIVASDHSDEVEPHRLRQWLRDEANPCRLVTTAKLRDRAERRGAGAIKIEQFFNALTTARGTTNRSGLAVSGARSANVHMARNLARNHTFTVLRGPLVFFVFDWAGENVDRYGRTLQTFFKNLPAITEEYEALLATERDYVRNQMIRHGLNEDFAVPDKWVKRAVEHSVTEAQRELNERFAL